MIKLLLILLPFGILSNKFYLTGHRISFFLAVFLIYSISMVREKALKLFGAYVGIWFIIIHVVNFSDGSKAAIRGAALIDVIHLMIAFTVMVAVSQSRASLKSYYNAICIGAIIQATLGFIQLFGFDPFVWFLNLLTPATSDNQMGRAIGTLGNPNFYGGYIAVSLPFFFRKGWKKFIPLLVITLIPLDPNAASAGAVGSAIAGAVVYYGTWQIVAVLGLAGVAFFIYDYESIFNGPRLEWWSMAFAKSTASARAFLFGYGPGVKTGLPHPLHNEWLEALLRYGVTGVILLLSAIARLAENQDRILFAALIAAMVNCTANYPLHLPPSAFLILIILGLMERERYGRISNERGYQG